MASPSSQEQFLLELINESRLDPFGSAARYLTSYAPLLSSDSRVQSALSYFNVSGSALQSAFAALVQTGPVAWNADLADAAEKHSGMMISTQTQSHQTVGELGLGERVTAEGYIWRGLGENVYAYAESLIYAHAGFMVDWGNGPDGMQSPAGHRVNIMNPSYKEVGIDVTAESVGTTPVGPLVVTQDFGWQANKLFVLGVAYNDADGDRFYSVGEGRSGLVVSSGGVSATSAASGGYSLETAAGARTITLSGAGLAGTLTVTTTLGTENIKLDVVGGNTLLTSGSVVVDGTIGTVRGLGARGLSITTGAGDQTIIGTAGDDTINGGAGTGDIAEFSGLRSAYTASAGSNGAVVITGAGRDTISNIEKFRFSDGEYFWNAQSGQLTTTQAPATNAAPATAASQSLRTLKDSPLQFTVSATDADNDPLIFSALTAGHGAVSGGTGGVFTYTPFAGFSGDDSFNVTVSDGRGGTAQQTINVKVTSVNSAPIPNSPTLTINTTVGSSGAVTFGATDPDGDAITFRFSAPKNGIAVDLRSDAVYVPNAGFVGTDSFTITYVDSFGATATQTVNVIVGAANRAPTFSTSSQKVTVYKDTAKTISAIATDPDGDQIIYTVFGMQNGKATVSNGIVTYTPRSGFVGTDTVSVMAGDAKGGQVVQTISITVSASAPPANRAPTVNATQAVTADEDATKAITVSATDADGDALSYSAGAASHGTVVKTTGGTFNYTPAANYTGTDSFVVTVNDGRGGTASQTVNVTVRNINDAPVFGAAQTVSATAGETKSVTVSATDVDGDTLTFTAGAAAHGTVVKTTGGTFNYTPASGYIGSDSFVVTANDGKGGTATQTVSLNVQQSFAGTPFRAFLPAGFIGAVGGKGTVFGTGDSQAVTLLDTPGNVSFDLSFKTGGDTIDLPGNASRYSIGRSGANAVITGPNGSYSIPVDSAGVRLSFDDGSRTLLYDLAAGTMKIGSQAFGAGSVGITAPADTAPLPGSTTGSGVGRVYLGVGSEAALGGDFTVFGTNSAEHLTYSFGRISLDPSFAAGGDLISFTKAAGNFSGYLAGSSLVILSADGTLTIPVPTSGLTLDFGGDTRTLRFDASSSQVMVGSQAITGRAPEAAIVFTGGTGSTGGTGGTGGSGGGTGGGTATSISGDVGNPATPLTVTLDATKAYVINDNALAGSNVIFRNLDENDTIRVTNALSSDYNFGSVDADNDGLYDDLMVTFSSTSAVNELVLLDVVSPDAFIRNTEASAEAALGWNLFTFA